MLTSRFIMKRLSVCTVSKFPPYMSGHSFEAMFQGKALFELTGKKHYEITYHENIYDKTVNYNPSQELLEESNKFMYVHRIRPFSKSNLKVFDGGLTKAFIGETINLIQEKDINVIFTYYLDPHAYIANQAKLYAKKVLNKKVITAHKAVGSDVLNSIGNHLNDGEGKFILLQFLEGDLKFAVSQYTKDKIIEYAKILLPKKLSNRLEKEIKVLYAPIDNTFFGKIDSKAIRDLKKKFNINPKMKVISYFGRVFPEKGIEDLITAFGQIKTNYPNTTLVIGGSGIKLDDLKLQAVNQETPDIIFTGSLNDIEKRALMQMSFFGVIATKPIANFVETLCISAIEYQASGCPLITTRVGGVPEAAGAHSLYANPGDPTDLAKKMSLLLENKKDRQKMIAAGLRHTRKFNYQKITKKFLKYLENFDLYWPSNPPLIKYNKDIIPFINARVI